MLGRRDSKKREREDEEYENELNEDFNEYNDEYEDFKVHKPMHKIRSERDRTFTNDENEKRVNFRKYRGRGWSRSHARGLPKRERSGPLNRTRDKSPFTYAAGVSLHRRSQSEKYPRSCSKKCKSWGVPWK
ncbi:hypothetical protein [Methanosarcina sp.]|uniref:hypothetical protein n=1 Tax=Methanosarcina sp. TaxID=2213 RepID=UPI002CA22B92|nr:hypothetical protein [Methanosarcina sp.]HOW13507.1 hypothetical protein [Methanosarcina sp.]